MRTPSFSFIQDDFLKALFPDEITDIAAFVDRCSRLRTALTPLIETLLAQGISVVLDFAANTRKQRSWFRELIDQSQVDHELQFIDVPDDICKAQLRQRSASLPAASRWTSDAEFDAVTAYFQAPAADENFFVVRHSRNQH